MISIQSIVLSSTISLFGIGDTGDAHLAVLVSQSAQQLAELNRLLKTANQTSQTLNTALELSEKLQRGIDQTLQSYRRTKQFQEALVRLGRNRDLKGFRENAEDVRDYVDYYAALFPKKAAQDQERRRDYDEFQDQVQKTAESDMKEIDSLEKDLVGASPARAQQISAQIQLKQLESQVITRQQLARLLEENNQLREEAARDRRRKQMEETASKKLIEDRWKKSWEPKR